jgi:sugar lactone lactonase YvrE
MKGCYMMLRFGVSPSQWNQERNMFASANWSAQIRVLLVAAFFLALSACGGGSSTSPYSPGSSTSTYSLSATVSGLSSSGLVLSVDGNALPVGGGVSSVTLASSLQTGFAYTVSVQTQPTGLSCSVTNGTGTIASANVGTVAINCSVAAYTIGGSISGLTTTGLVLLNNGEDPTTIPANATQFSMHTTLSPGAGYNITVGKQPYGITLACTIANASGTTSSNVTTVAVTCAAVSPTQISLANYFTFPEGVAVDAAGNVFVADSTEKALFEIPYVQGSYGTPVVIASGFTLPGSVAVDAAENVFVADSNEVKEVPYSNGKYGAPVVIGSSFGSQSSSFSSGTFLSIDRLGNLYVAVDNIVQEIPYSGGSYGTPVTIGAGFNGLGGVAVDAALNVYVADGGNRVVKKIPYSGGSYGTPVVIGSGFSGPGNLAMDLAGNVFVVDTSVVGSGFPTNSVSVVKEIPITGGSYGAPVVVSSEFGSAAQSGEPRSVAVDAHGNVFVAVAAYSNYDAGRSPIGGEVEEIAYSGGSYGTPAAVGTGFVQPYGVAVDATGNVFVTDTGNSTLKEIPYSGGSYSAPVLIGVGFNQPRGVAVDVAGNLFVADYGNNVVKEIPYSAGNYGTPVVIGTGFDQPQGVAVDAHDDVFVTDMKTVTEIPYSAGTYGAPLVIASGYGGVQNNFLEGGVAVDAAGNVFVDQISNGFPFVYLFSPTSGGQYSQAMVGTVTPGGAAEVDIARGVAVDAYDNVFVGSYNGPTTFGQLVEFPYLGPTYKYLANPNGIAIGGDLTGPSGVALDTNGRLFVVTVGNVLKLVP